MVPEHYVWFAWSTAFLVPWFALYVIFSAHRGAMLWASLFTMPLGLTEPLFVPSYWNPPSLFDLARTTGFDVESLIFCFGIGGVGAVLYNVSTGVRSVRLAPAEHRNPLHRHHHLALAAPFITFPALYYFRWNPIYPAILAMLIGAAATIACRPDLKRKTWIGGLLFLSYYAIFLGGLEWLSPGYIEHVWNMSALSGLTVMSVPVEELLFAAAFGAYWAGAYEHFTWHRDERMEQ